MKSLEIISNGQVPFVLTDFVRQSAAETFGAICGAEPTYRGNGDDSVPVDGLVGIISFVGDVAWSLRLGLPRESAIALAQKFAGFEIDFDSNDMSDVVGEMANVIAGDIIARLDARGVKAQMSLPAVARGRDIQLPLPDGQSGVRMLYDAPEGAFWVTLVTARPDQLRLRK